MFAECSAKTGEGIEEAFVTLLRRVVKERADKHVKAAANKPQKQLAKACVVL